MPETLTIDARYCGPPQSANGGYLSGLLATHMDGPAEVTLHSPPPLDTPLVLTRHDGGLQLRHDDLLVAEACPCTTDDFSVPEPVSLADAEVACQDYPGCSEHPFPSCFVCGPARSQGDGLRIFAGPVTGRELVAAPWAPDAALADADGRVRTELLWAALDCPSWFGAAAFRPELRVGLLARFAVHVTARPRTDEPCVVVGWADAVDGRKIHTGSAVFDADGQPAGVARALWIRPR